MKRRVRTILFTASTVTMLSATVLAPSVGAWDAPAQAEVPISGQSVLGDGQYPTATASGPASAYANSEFSAGVQNNVVVVTADNPPYSGRFQLITEQTTTQPAQPVRRLFLNMPSIGIANYRCDYGPEDPARASNKNYARLGAQISVLGGKAQLLCFQRNPSTGAYTGYHVYTPYTCVAIIGGPRYVVNGTGCVADVYFLNKNQQRQIAYHQPFSLYVEASST
jgi:hypothetical protein